MLTWMPELYNRSLMRMTSFTDEEMLDLIDLAAQLKALEDKAAGNVRSGISNASSLGQHLALAAYADKGYARQKRQKYEVLRRRYMAIRRLLADNPGYAEFFEPMPFNSGYFMCVKPRGVDAEDVRRHLVAKYSTGVIVLSGLIRLAFSTVPMARLPELFANVAAAIADLREGQKDKGQKTEDKG